MRAFVLLFLLAGAGGAEDLRTLARQKFDQGRTEFAAQHFDKALALFRDSYQLAPYPDLLFNIARCYEAMNQYRDALDSYDRYLVVNPGDEEARRRANEMRRKVLEEPLPLPEPSPTPTPQLVKETPRPTPVYKEWWLWTAVVGVATVALGVGLGVGLSQPNPQRTFPPLGSP
jgi:tetratricopeptide (TPR) repeat protein